MPVQVTPAPSFDIYDSPFISAGQPWTINHHDKNYLYVYSPISFVMSVGTYGSTVIPQNQWTFIPYPDGIQARAPTFPAGMQISVLATNTVLATDAQPRTGHNAYVRSGQAYSITTGMQTVSVANNWIAIAIIIQNTPKDIHVVRAIAATNATTPQACLLGIDRNPPAVANMTGVPQILNHAANVLLAAPFLPVVGVISSLNPSTVTATPPNVYNMWVGGGQQVTELLFPGEERVIQKGGNGIIYAFLQMSDTTHLGACGLSWHEEL